MKQAIAGVTSPDADEVTSMTVWPSLAALSGGRFWGRLYNLRAGNGVLPLGLTLGKLIAFASIPLILPPYFLMLNPGAGVPGTWFWIDNPWCRRYRLTNRRIIVEHGMGRGVERSVPLDGFDSVEVAVQPGQEWYKAGDLVFRKGTVETFRLSGVPRPETFRQVCLKAHGAYVGVRRAMAHQPA